MNHKRAFSGFSFLIVTLVALDLATPAAATPVDYRAVITVQTGAGATVGYVAEDPNYWTPLLTPTSVGALIVDFRLDGTSGSQIDLSPQNSGQGYPFFGLTEGRDSTSPDIAPGSFNYLYLEGTNGTPAGSTPQLVPNYFAVSTGIAKSSESAIWNIDVNALTLIPVWINSDSSTPTTFVFVQSNHVYAGGDPAAFHARFPAPVTDVTLHLEILSATPASVADFSSTWTLLLLALTALFCLRPFLRQPA